MFNFSLNYCQVIELNLISLVEILSENKGEYLRLLGSELKFHVQIRILFEFWFRKSHNSLGVNTDDMFGNI